MGILETLRGKLGLQPIDANLVGRLKTTKQAYETQRKLETEQLRQTAVIEERQLLQQDRKNQETFRRLSGQANKLLKPQLEAIKKVYVKGRHPIKLQTETDSWGRAEGVYLNLVWDHSIKHHEAHSSGRLGGAFPSFTSEQWKKMYFYLREDGFGTFGMSSYVGQDDTPTVRFNLNDPSWRTELADKIPGLVENTLSQWRAREQR